MTCLNSSAPHLRNPDLTEMENTSSLLLVTHASDASCWVVCQERRAIFSELNKTVSPLEGGGRREEGEGRRRKERKEGGGKGREKFIRLGKLYE